MPYRREHPPLNHLQYSQKQSNNPKGRQAPSKRSSAVYNGGIRKLKHASYPTARNLILQFGTAKRQPARPPYFPKAGKLIGAEPVAGGALTRAEMNAHITIHSQRPISSLLSKGEWEVKGWSSKYYEITAQGKINTKNHYRGRHTPDRLAFPRHCFLTSPLTIWIINPRIIATRPPRARSQLKLRAIIYT